jgi:hypothetical protein
MSDLRSERIKELVSRVRKVGLKKCSFEFYRSTETEFMKSKVNRDVEKVPALIKEIRKEHGLAFCIKDTLKMSRIEVKRVYDQCAHWAQNPKNHEFGRSQVIYDLISGGEAGDRFGRERPAMIVYDSCSGDVIFVIPHEVQKDEFSLKQHLQSGEGSSRPEATISIYDFLKYLKEDLDSHT